MIRFLHTADWQLGMTRHFLGPDAQPRYSAARLDAVRAIGELAAVSDCAAVLVCGDVFESNQVERRIVVRALEAMAEAPVEFLLLPGNHDPLDASSVFRSPTFVQHRPDNVRVLDHVGPHPLAPGVEVVAAPWVNKQPLADPVAAAHAGLTADGTVRIVAGHGAADSLAPGVQHPSHVAVDPLRSLLRDGSIHYVALGDRHSTTDVADGRVWYPGTPEATDYDEVDPGNVLVVELSTEHCRVTPHHLGSWRFVRHEAELTGADDVEALGRWLGALPDKSRTIVKLGLVGQLSLGAMARLDELLEHHRDLLAALEAWDLRSELVTLPDLDDVDRLALAGFASAALEDLRQLADGRGDDAVTARDALGLLYRLGVGAS